jgi:hypothetical protein
MPPRIQPQYPAGRADSLPPDREHLAGASALAGAVVAGVGGLFAVGIPLALSCRDLSVVFRFPMVGMVCLCCSAPVGWAVGGRLGWWLGGRLRHPMVHWFGGACGGLLPVTLVLLVSWYLTRGR